MNSIKPRIHDKLLLPVMRDVFLAFYKRASITGIGDKKAGTTINRATSRHVQAREGYDQRLQESYRLPACFFQVIGSRIYCVLLLELHNFRFTMLSTSSYCLKV